MKRSAALARLSRDHHQALVVARDLCRADAGDVEAAAERFVAFMDGEGARHFAIEEALVLPAAGDDEEGGRLVERVHADHAELRDAVAELRAAVPGVDRAHEVGDRLRAHVRLEERELFPYLEAHLPEERLEHIAQRFEALESEPAEPATAEGAAAAAALVQRFLDAFTARDLDTLLSCAHPEIELHPVRLTGTAAYEGHDGIRRWLKDLETPTARVTFAVGEIRGIDAGRAIAHVELVIPPEATPVTAIFLIREDRIIRVRGYFSDEPTLEHVGAL